ncbi:MAG: FIVAR domain-containing protein [Hominenteromicrobium sp.]
MKKRIASVLLALILVLGMLPFSVSASDVTEISTQAGLAAMESTGGSYKLTADITLTGWSPIYSSGVTLDGNGHTITLTSAPLFYSLGSSDTVKNLVLEGYVCETGNTSVGALARSSSGTIRNCISRADVTYEGAWNTVYVGGLVGKTSGTISNCLTTGTITNTGGAKCYGSVANIAMFESGTIQNCVAVGCDRLGTREDLDWNTFEDLYTPIESASSTVIGDASLFVPASYVSFFNANLAEGDLNWSAEGGTMTLTAAGGDTPGKDPDAAEEALAALNDAVAAAESVSTTVVYTTESWGTFRDALKEAKAVLDSEDPTQSKVTAAAESLTAAQNALVVRSLSAVARPDDAIEVDQAYFNTYMDMPSDNKYYVLTEDITVGGYWFGIFSKMNCVLDGNGHTITLNGGTLWDTIGPDGVIQNLGILGSAQNSTNDTGALATNCEGLIVNCWSRAAVTSAGMNSIIKNAGGFTANLKSGGAIVNSYVAGSVSASGSTGTGVAGALAGTSESNTLVQNGYWLNTVGSSAVGAAGGLVTGCAAQPRDAFYSDDFLALLNSGKGENGRTWTINDEGWPHLGESGSYAGAESFELVYTANEGYGSGSTTFTDKQGLLLSLSEVLPDPDATVNDYAGRFSCPDFDGEAAFVGQYASGGQGKHTVFVSEEGSLQVLAAGSLEIVVYDKASWSGTQYETELTRFTVTVDDITAEAIRMIPTGEYVTENDDGTYEVAGSGLVNLRTEILMDGEWRGAPSSLFTLTTDGRAFSSGSTFYATEPGEITVTAAALGQTASVTVTSTYVPVTSITPAVSGTYTIHGRNANSQSSGDFLDLMLSHGAGTVVVEPENASYRDSWTLESSDPEVAEYVSAFLRAVLPKKAGTVTLTATSKDPRLSEQVTGTSTITLKYLNPLTDVTLDPAAELTLEENETLLLPLAFTGSEGMEDYHVSEPGMIWTFSGDGEVEITRSPLGIIVGKENSPEYCIANPEYKMTGVKAGTVTVTGTPIDRTGGAESITFTVTVEPGVSEADIDLDKLVSDGIAGAQSVLLSAYAGREYQFGDEWAVFLFTRAGCNLTDAQISSYLNSVTAAYTNPKASALKPTTIARVILAVSALGQDAADLNGIDLTELLCTSKMIPDGSNEAAWALIALDSCDYPIPEGALWTREALIPEILKFRNPDTGAFGLLDNQSADIDVTAMCIQALAPYYDSNAQAKAAVDAALRYLQTQLDRGCDLGSSESVSQVLIALTALNLDPLNADNGFYRSVSRNLITALDAYRTENGGYRHLMTDNSLNNMATTQALQALLAYTRFTNGQSTLYDLTGTQQPDTPTEDDPIAGGGTEDPSDPTEPANPDAPDAPESSAKPDAGSGTSGTNGNDPAVNFGTGDHNNLLLPMLGLSAGLIALALLFVLHRKKHI